MKAKELHERITPTAEVFYAEPWVDMHNRMKEALVLLGKLPRAVVRPPLVKLAFGGDRAHPRRAGGRRAARTRQTTQRRVA